uniref:Choline O-acetyltransferase n=1 Tax=Parascaris equorum TaxID=6256 RepID=A0A914RJC1_PAREQ
MYTRIGGELLNQSEIAHQLSEVVRMCENRPGGTVIPIGGGSCVVLLMFVIMTVNIARERPERIRTSIRIFLERAIFIRQPMKSNCLQLIVSNDGTNGLLIEHSVAEGIVIINMAEYALRVSAQNANRKITDGVKRLLTPKALSWYVAPAAQALLLKQIETFDDPDGFVQLSMQLAYYRLHGRLVSTYESASIRRFFHGRVDNIRAATPESLLWALKKKLFEEAAKKQALITLENITGFGIDNHLCALNVLATEQVERGKLSCLPEIFTDPIWTETMRFPLSTSQVTTSWKNTYLCYGPVVRDGYGCSYNIQANSIIFAPSALKSCPTTNVDKFKGALVESLRDMKMLVT